jgi:hypothetical protein
MLSKVLQFARTDKGGRGSLQVKCGPKQISYGRVGRAHRGLVVSNVRVILDAQIVPSEGPSRDGVDEHAILFFPHVTGAQCLNIGCRWSGRYCRVYQIGATHWGTL